MPSLDGGREWVLSREQDPENPYDFVEYTQRRSAQDRDLWVLELDHPKSEQIMKELTATG